MLGNKFNVILKNSAKWEWWMVEISSTLKSFTGSKEIPVAYVISVADFPKL